MLHLAHNLHPLDTFDEHRIVLNVIHYFSEHFSNPFTIPCMSGQLGISLLHIETAFDLYKGTTANEALLEYRLNRLCDLMSRDPSRDIGKQISECGLAFGSGPTRALFCRTNEQFITHFGIDLVEYHQQCFLAEAARLSRHSQPRREHGMNSEVIGEPLRRDLHHTRFHGQH